MPGCGGNQLEAKLNKPKAVNFMCWLQSDVYRIWLDPGQMVPVLVDCWADNMKLSYDNMTRTTKNSPGVNITVPGWGTVQTMDVVDPTPVINNFDFGFYFYYITTALRANGYDSHNMLGAPYDFRKGPSEFKIFSSCSCRKENMHLPLFRTDENKKWFRKVQELAEDAYERNDRQRVTFVAHSMGGLMVLQFLKQMTREWKETYVKQIITMSTPWGGSVQSLQAVSVGYDFKSPMVSNAVMKEVQETCPSLVWLLPSPNFWKSNETLIKTTNKQYSVANLDQFFL